MGYHPTARNTQSAIRSLPNGKELVTQMNSTGSLDDNLHHLVDIKRRTGFVLRLKPFDQITKVVYKSDDEIIVQLITHEMAERRFDTYLTARGVKLIPLNRQADGTWRTGEAFVMWEEGFQRVRIAAFTPNSVADYWEKRIHEFMCHRPGIPSYPMENASFGDCTTPQMTRHWRI